MNAIRFGICGIGRMGKHRAHVFARYQDQYKVAAFCDTDESRVSRLTSELGGRGYTDFAAFIADPDMELAIIATRSLDHARHAEQALAAGKTVLLEKPIGVTASDYALLQRLVQQYPGKLYFCHNHRFEPAFMKAFEIMNAGALGNVFLIKICHHRQFMRRNDWQTRLDCGGGQLSVMGPHNIDHGVQMMGAPVREVHSYLRRILSPGDADDHVKIILIGENNRVVELEISNSMAIPGPFCSVFGDRGSLKYDFQDSKTIQMKYLEPDFQWKPVAADAGTPEPGRGMHSDPTLPWIEETREFKADANLWEEVEVELAQRLHGALRLNIPFPVTSADALEVVRITEIVKKQNPQFKWIG